MELIFYLYKLIKSSSSSTFNYPLLLHLFSCTITPLIKLLIVYIQMNFLRVFFFDNIYFYLSFIELWIFEGKFYDPFDEFLININHNYLNSKGNNHFHINSIIFVTGMLLLFLFNSIGCFTYRKTPFLVPWINDDSKKHLNHFFHGLKFWVADFVTGN